MQFLATRTHLRGSMLERRDLVKMPPVLGELLTAETEDPTYKGTVRSVKLQDPAGGSPARDLFPPLYQVQLANVAPGGMLLTGYEIIDEHGKRVSYAQGWWLRLP